MINWNKEDWESIKSFLEELDYDYTTEMNGNLILHFQDFDIVDENTNEVVDSVEHMWLIFNFHSSGESYEVLFKRQDVYNSDTGYTHPHVNNSGSSHCTGDYVKGISLLRDILYYTSYIRQYNSGNGWTSIPDTNIKFDTTKLNKNLIPEFYLDISLGYPVIKTVEFNGNLEDCIEISPLSNPSKFFWKDKVYVQKNKGWKVENINFGKYFLYDKFFESYHNSTSNVSNLDTLQEIQ